MRHFNQDTTTQAVMARLADVPDARLKEVMTSLVQHLHAFARESRLTEAEWQAGIEFLTAVGQRSRADRLGGFELDSIEAPSYPVSTDGPVGGLLAAMALEPWRPAHVHFRIGAAGYQTLVTHVYREGDPHLDTDAVYGVRESLIVPWLEDEQGRCSMAFDFVLQGAADRASVRGAGA